MARKSNDTLILVLVTVGLFALSCAMRFFLADFQKGIGVLPDEIRYLDLASSLFNDGQLVERGGLSSFQKILYPLSLFPAFLVDDPETRVRVIALLNSIYVSSAVFPALVLARRLFTSKAPVIVCLVFTLVMPDMCYSMTFLSECIYLPLVLWLVACCLRALETRGRAGYAWCAGAGLLCYVTYLAKEVALGFALAFIVMMVVRIVCRWGDEATHEGDAGAKPSISSRPAMSAMRSCEDCLSARFMRASPAAASHEAQVGCEGKPAIACRIRPPVTFPLPGTASCWSIIAAYIANPCAAHMRMLGERATRVRFKGIRGLSALRRV